LSITPISKPPFERPEMPKRRGRGDVARHQIALDRVEIVIDALPVRQQPRSVPRRAELTAAAYVS